jgi:glutathione S-transferase
MKLYYLPGTSSLFPHIVLVESGLPFELAEVNEHTKTVSDGRDYRSVNPLGYVPALELDDGSVLTEAVAIAQYVADQVPDKKLAPPNGTFARARLQSWLNLISSELQLGCFCPLFDRDIPPPVKANFRRRLNSRLTHVEQHLRENTYLLGNAFSIADVYLFVVGGWAGAVNADLAPYPRVLDLRKRVGARPATQGAVNSEKRIL